MIKRLFLAICLCLTLAAVPANAAIQEADGRAQGMQDQEVVAEMPDGQVEVEAPVVESRETNTVEESETTRRMLQIQKANDLKENDSFGGAVTIMSMVIVLAALILLSLLFLCFGKISAKLLSMKKKEAIKAAGHEDIHDHEDLESGELVAAISLALAEHFGVHHDIEDTNLTIKRMRRAYSPWNSKIYNLREVPEHHRNERK